MILLALVQLLQWHLELLLSHWKLSKIDPSCILLLHLSLSVCNTYSPDLTWRDIQYLIVYTSNPNLTNTSLYSTNGAGLRVSREFGFGAMDAEAMVTRARHWINVPTQRSVRIVPDEHTG